MGKNEKSFQPIKPITEWDVCSMYAPLFPWLKGNYLNFGCNPKYYTHVLNASHIYFQQVLDGLYQVNLNKVINNSVLTQKNPINVIIMCFKYKESNQLDMYTPKIVLF